MNDRNREGSRVRRDPEIRGRCEGRRGGSARRRGPLPILKGLPGFRAYYAFVGDDGRPVSVSIVESRAAAVAANERAREWVGASMRDLIPDPPEVVMGEMLVDAATFGEEGEDRAGDAGAPWKGGGI